MLARLNVEHELREGAMQMRKRAAQQAEPRAGELRSSSEVEHPERFPKIGVILGFEIEDGRRSDAAHLDVFLRRLADRHRRMRKVRQVEEKIAKLGLHVGEFVLE